MIIISWPELLQNVFVFISPLTSSYILIQYDSETKYDSVRKHIFFRYDQNSSNNPLSYWKPVTILHTGKENQHFRLPISLRLQYFVIITLTQGGQLAHDTVIMLLSF